MAYTRHALCLLLSTAGAVSLQRSRLRRSLRLPTALGPVTSLHRGVSVTFRV